MTAIPRVAARILAPDLPCLWHELAVAVRSGVDRVHVDVMGGGTADVTVGPLAWRALRRVTRVPFEVHLLVRPDERVIAAFAEAGAEAIAFHPEASEDVGRTLALVRAHGCQAGLALAPGTPLSVVERLAPALDLVVVTWAAPGLEGQHCSPPALHWIRALRSRLDALDRRVMIAVDGGVGPDTVDELVAAGADTLVLESASCRPPAVLRAAGHGAASRPSGPAPRQGPAPAARS
jgi:ribulose-phosphate 3-epimerase